MKHFYLTLAGAVLALPLMAQTAVPTTIKVNAPRGAKTVQMQERNEGRVAPDGSLRVSKNAVRKAAPAHAAQAPRRAIDESLYNVTPIMSEDFSCITQGSEADPYAIMISTPEKTIEGMPGWEGEDVYATGGSILVRSHLEDDDTFPGMMLAVGDIFTPWYEVKGGSTIHSTINVKALPDPEEWDLEEIGQTQTGWTGNFLILGTSSEVPGEYTVVDFQNMSAGYPASEVQDFTTELPEMITVRVEGEPQVVPLTAIRIKLFTPNMPFFVYDIAMEAIEPKVQVPIGLDYSNFSNDGFTAHWERVLGATKYVIKWYSSTYDIENYRYILHEEGSAETRGTKYNIELPTENAVFFNVTAYKGEQPSPQSDPCKVFDVLPPVMQQPEKVNELNFTATWEPALGATGTDIMVYKAWNVREAAKEYEFINFDFLSNPDYETGSPYLNLDEYQYGWNAMPYQRVANGELVLDNEEELYGLPKAMLFSNAYDFSGITSNATVLVTARAEYGGMLIAATEGVNPETGGYEMMGAQIVMDLTEEPGVCEYSLPVNSSEMQFLFAVEGYGRVYIDDIKIILNNVPANTLLSKPFLGEYTDNTKLILDTPVDEDAEMIRLVGRSIKELTVEYYGNPELVAQAVSNYSAPVVFANPSSGVQTVDEAAEAPVYYNLQGIRVDAPAEGTLVIRRQGADASLRFAK